MKKTYNKLDVSLILVETEGSFASSEVNSIQSAKSYSEFFEVEDWTGIDSDTSFD